jgi:hypothetical protein
LISFTGYSETWAHGLSIENNPERFFLGLAILVVSRIVFKFVEIRDHTKEKSGEKVEQVLSVAKGKKFVIPFSHFQFFVWECFVFLYWTGTTEVKSFPNWTDMFLQVKAWLCSL